MTQRKVRREKWKSGYRNVIRNEKGWFVSWGKWSPVYTTSKFEDTYKAKQKIIIKPLHAKYIYNFAVYLKEDGKTGTSVKLELYIKNFVTDLSPSELERVYKSRLIETLKSEVGVEGEHRHFKLIILRQDESFKPKSKHFVYSANVLNINTFASAKYRYIRSIEGSLDVD